MNHYMEIVMKLLSISLLAAFLTGCAVYPDAPVATYPSSTGVYGSYYSGYPYYDHPHYGRSHYGHDRHDHHGQHKHHDRGHRDDKPAYPAPVKALGDEKERRRELVNRMRRADDERDARGSRAGGERDQDRGRSGLSGLMRERSSRR